MEEKRVILRLPSSSWFDIFIVFRVVYPRYVAWIRVAASSSSGSCRSIPFTPPAKKDKKSCNFHKYFKSAGNHSPHDNLHSQGKSCLGNDNKIN